MRTGIAILALITALSFAPLRASGGRDSNYDAVQVMRFTVEPGTEIPQDYVVATMEDLVKQLRDTHRFHDVLRDDQTPAAGAHTLQIAGTITRFNKGNRALRYAVGFGAGKTKIVAHVKFIDTATGAVALERDVDGKVWMGVMGGSSSGAGKGLAKEVAKLATKNF